jgi:hypothetical protein
MHDAILNTALVRAIHSTTRRVSVRRGGGGQPQPQVSIECAPDAPEHRGLHGRCARVLRGGAGEPLDLPRDASGDQIARALRLLERIAA